jgi:hypothetical protein
MFAKSVAVADVVEDCHWIEPTEPVAKVRVLLAPLQIAPAPEIVFTTDNGFTVKVATFEVTVPQDPFVKITRYLVPVNKVADFLIFKVAEV